MNIKKIFPYAFVSFLIMGGTLLSWQPRVEATEYIFCKAPIGVCDRGCKNLACFIPVTQYNDFNYTVGTLTVANSTGNTETATNPKNNPSCQGDPVYLHSGQFFYQCSDLMIPGRKLDVDIVHTYFSGMYFNGPFGYGWTLNYYMRLHKLRNGSAIIVSGDGRKSLYTYSGGNYIPPAGQFEELVKNVNNSWTLTQAHGEKYEFDIDGKLTAIKDRNNNTITLTYGAVKQSYQGYSTFGQNPSTRIVIGTDYRLTGITDTNGRSLTLNYNTNGLLESIVDGSRQLTYAYDSATNDLLSVTKPATAQFPSGVTKSFVYEDHNVTKVRDPKLQYFVENSYDAQGRVYQQNLGGNNILFNYNGSQTTVTDRNSNVVTYVVNNSGNVTSKTENTRSIHTGDPASFVTNYDYNSDSLMTSVKYPKGNGVKFVYDEAMTTGTQDYRAKGNLLEMRRKTSMVAADDNTNDLRTLYTYETHFNLPKTITDPKGNATTNTYYYEVNTPSANYDANVVKITQPTVGQITPEINFTYNAYGQPLTVTDANNNVTEYEYFSATGYVQNIIRDPSGIDATTSFTYDTNGYLDTVTDPEMHVTDYDYDALGWLNQVTNPRGYLTKYTYDANGNVAKIERQANAGATLWQTTEMTYDILNHLHTVEDPLDRITTYNYDNNENLNSIVDAENNTTSFVYDERNLKFTVTDASTPAGVTRYDYDLNGNLKKITDANAQETAYAYDLFDRLETTTYEDSLFEKNVYDKNSNVTEHWAPSEEKVKYVYDELNRLTTKFYLPDEVNAESTFIYDAGSRLTDANNEDAEVHYTYDALNRIEAESQTTALGTLTTDVTYWENDLVKTLTYPTSSNVIGYEYDANNNLDLVKKNTVTVTDYAYDLLDRRETKSYSTNPVQQTSYAFDLANQLSGLQQQVLPSTNISHYQYPVYDDVGNRKQLGRTLGANPLETSYFNYNDIYELTSVTGAQSHTYDYDKVGNRETVDSVSYVPNALNQYSSVNSVTFTYDDNGNLTDDGPGTMTYDRENRLKTFTDGTVSATYAYDALNRRVLKTVDSTTTHFIYQGDQIIQDRDGTGNVDAEYIFGSGIDEVLTMTRGEDDYYYHYDGLGSVTEITDADGTVVENYTYDPYGTPSVVNSTVGNRYRFTGREFDEESGLYYYRARIYDPSIGRFLQRDPIGYYDGMNLYSYVGNNSTNFVDPLGLTQEELDKAYDWLKIHHPELTNKNTPKAIDKRLGGDDTGFTPPFKNEIWVDTDKIHRDLGGQDWIVNMTAHELMHRNKGTVTTVWEDLITGGKSHDLIYDDAEIIRSEYLDWLDEMYEKQRKECNESK